MAKTYSLIYLDENLKRLGISKRCFKYSISDNKACLHISYLDFLFNEQFIFVFRTSRLCYRIYYNGLLTSKRTCAKATSFLNDILITIIQASEYYSVMTVAELNQLDIITQKEKLEFYRRTKKTN